MVQNDVFNFDFDQFLFSFVCLGERALFPRIFACCRAILNYFESGGTKHSFRGVGSWEWLQKFKRCAVEDMVSTGSYQATLNGISLCGVGFEAVPFGPFDFH